MFYSYGDVTITSDGLQIFTYTLPLENVLLIWRCHHYQLWAANFYLYSALIAIDQWGFFSVPNLRWHETSFYTGHLQGPVTQVTERLAVELSPSVSMT